MLRNKSNLKSILSLIKEFLNKRFKQSVSTAKNVFKAIQKVSASSIHAKNCNLNNFF